MTTEERIAALENQVTALVTRAAALEERAAILVARVSLLEHDAEAAAAPVPTRRSFTLFWAPANAGYVHRMIRNDADALGIEGVASSDLQKWGTLARLGDCLMCTFYGKPAYIVCTRDPG